MTHFFFFKQKTAYELRISDWSSDVCSSDLRFRSALQPLYMKLSAAAFHDRGVLEWDEELIDYSRVETTRETDDGDETNEHREVERQIGRASCRERVCQ